ncbi:MAG: type II secretion system minor pseudopilin GspK, partial [Parasphingopyxis sp.]
MRPGKPSEEGAALLAVLLLVAIMAALAAASMERLQLATRLAGNISALDQSRAFATGAESLAVLRINDLLASDNSKTTLAGGWMGDETALPLPGGGVALATIWDGGNCFNLNSVARGEDPAALTIDQVGVVQFSALMTALQIPRGDAERIAWSLADWIDA